MPRRRLHPTDFDMRVRNMLESQGAPAMAGVARVAGARTAPVGGNAPDAGTAGRSLVIDVGDGAVPTGHTKGHWVAEGRTMRRVTATLSVAGSSATVANVLRNGSVVGTLTIPAGQTVASADVGASFSTNDFWQMHQTSAGTGAGGLTYFGDFG